MRWLNFGSVLVAALLFSACSDEPNTNVESTLVRPAKMTTLGVDQSRQSLRYPAVLAAGKTANLSFTMGGIIQTIDVNEAQEVAAGDELAALDTRDLVNNLTSARAQFENAEDEYQRGRRLFEQDALAKTVFEQRKTQREVAEAQLDSAEKALADATLRAPFSGLIATVNADEQQTVQGGSTIITLIGMEELTATVNIPARVVTRAARQDDIPAYITFDSLPDVRLPVTFKEATLIADSASQTYAVTFRFDRPENNFLLPGMTATVEIAIPEASVSDRGGIAVPISAISSDAGGRYVWLVEDESMTVSRQRVEVADGIGEMLVVESGLKAGDTIVSAGGGYLAEGMQVRRWEEQTDHLK